MGQIIAFSEWVRKNREQTSVVSSAVVSSSYSEHVAHALSYLQEHFTENISVRDAARYCHISESRLMHLFRDEVGESVHAWIIRNRIEKSSELIVAGQEIMKVWLEVGYTDYSLFYRNFVKVMGCNPSIWQEKNVLSKKVMSEEIYNLKETHG